MSDPYIDREREKAQTQQPGYESGMIEPPVFIRHDYRGSGKLEGKAALITGGDSGIGRAVAVHFAREGADVGIVYLNEDDDAETTRRLVEAEGAVCYLFQGDVGDPEFCQRTVDEFVDRFGKIYALINNAAEQHPREAITDISEAQMLKTFRTNVFGYFNMTKAALPHIPADGRIINTSSVVAHRGSHHLLDYAATKGAVESFTRSLAQQVTERHINVNCVAPGPVWTPLIPSTFDNKSLHEFGSDTMMGRPGQPCEVATCYVFLASRDGDYMTGQTLHPNGGGNIGN